MSDCTPEQLKEYQNRETLRNALKLCLELAENALDHAHPRNSASISAIAKTAHQALKETQP